MADYSTAARPYARAIFETAQQEGRFDDWSARLEFWAALVSNPEMAQRLEEPGATAAEKSEMVETVAADGMDDESRNFLRLLAENERLLALPAIRENYEAFRAKAEGLIEASVVSAFELDDAQRERIADALGKRLDRKVNVTCSVDDSLMGGAIVHAGDLVIDGSLKGRLEKMSRAIAG